jgi:hypothetical protein
VCERPRTAHVVPACYASDEAGERHRTESLGDVGGGRRSAAERGLLEARANRAGQDVEGGHGSCCRIR